MAGSRFSMGIFERAAWFAAVLVLAALLIRNSVHSGSVAPAIQLKPTRVAEQPTPSSESLESFMTASVWLKSGAGWEGECEFLANGTYVTEWGEGHWKVEGPGCLFLKNSYDPFFHRLTIDTGKNSFIGVRSDGEPEEGRLIGRFEDGRLIRESSESPNAGTDEF